MRRTSKLLVVHEDVRTGGIAAEIAALVTESLFGELDGPIRRVTGLDTPVPFSPPLEEYFLPSAEKIAARAQLRELLRRRTESMSHVAEQEKPMAVEVVMPQMGESIFEGTVTKWLKKPGDRVERDEPLFEISTDKVDAEIQSPAAGVLTEIKVGEGQTVPIRTVVAVIDDGGAADCTGAGQRKRAAPTAPAAPPPPRPAPAQTARRRRGRQRAHLAAGAATGARTQHGPLHGARHRRRRAHQQAGRAGRSRRSPGVARRRVHPAAPCRRAPRPAAHVVPHAALESAVPRERIYFGRYQVQPMSVMRQRIAEHMVLSKRVSPHVYSVDEADMTRIVGAARHRQGRIREAQQHQAHLHAVFRARLRRSPARLPHRERFGGRNQHRAARRDQHRHRRGAGRRPDRAGAEKRRRERISWTCSAPSTTWPSARATKKLHPDEVHESTFSITNPGVFGGLMGLPVINQPNVAILAIGAIQKRPVVVNDAVVPRSMVYLTLSYDHRVVDGAVAHQFMGRIKQRLESWDEQISDGGRAQSRLE